MSKTVYVSTQEGIVKRVSSGSKLFIAVLIALLFSVICVVTAFAMGFEISSPYFGFRIGPGGPTTSGGGPTVPEINVNGDGGGTGGDGGGGGGGGDGGGGGGDGGGGGGDSSDSGSSCLLDLLCVNLDAETDVLGIDGGLDLDLGTNGD